MSAKRLPNLIDPERLAQKHTRCTGTVALATLPRLKTLLADTSGDVSVTMDFDCDENHVSFVHLKASVTLMLTCQRCMNTMDYPIEIDVLLTPVKKATDLANQTCYEPMVMEGDLIAVQDIVEDEILLNLPLIAKHTQTDCPVLSSALDETITENPFKRYFAKLLPNHKPEE